MVNKKILVSFLLIVLMAVSLSAVSAADAVADDVAADDSIILGDDAGQTSADFEKLIDDAKEGDTITINGTYTFDKSVTVTKGVTIKGDNAIVQGNGGDIQDGLIAFDGANNAKITGVTFINTDDPDKYLYNGDTKIKPVGIALEVKNAAIGVEISNCTFENWFNSGVSVSGARNTAILNNLFYGGTATFINNIPDGPKDRGTYHISAMSSTGTLIQGNTFDSPVCDGVSIAGSSMASTVTGNYFNDNAYAIYFGGRSTEGTLIEKNVFTNCGWFESEVYTTNGTPTGENVSFFDLPVISVQKSADSFEIKENTFNARNGNILIKALEGSTAHGGASPIGNITITDNVVNPIDDSVFMPSVTLVYIETYNDVIRPIGEIKISNNKLNGAKSAGYWTTQWGDVYGDVSIVAPELPTVIAISSIIGESISGVLKDVNNKELSGETIAYSTDDTNGTVETDSDGSFTLDGVKGNVTFAFAGDEKYSASEATVFVKGNPIKTKLLGPGVRILANEDGVFKATLLVDDGTDTPIVGKKVKVVINGKNYVNTTDEDGVATINFVGYKESRPYTVSVYFPSNNDYASAYRDSKVVVDKKAITIDAPNYNYRVSASKQVTVTLKDQTDKPVAGKPVSISVNGQTLTANTNGNGVATFTPSINSAGTYTYYARFAGDVSYYGKSVSGTIVVS